MKRSSFIFTILALLAVSCQNSGSPEELQERVIASPEFAALAEAYQNRGSDQLQELEEKSRKLDQELAGLPPEEMQARQKEIDEERRVEQEKAQEKKKLLDERNRQIKALLAGEKKLSKSEFEEAVRQIDQSLGITQEVISPAKTQRIDEAMAALLEKFPKIKEQSATFIQDCLSAYKVQKAGRKKGE